MIYNNHYNPNQPRDKNGEWTDIPGHIATKIKANIDSEHETQMRSYRATIESKMKDVKDDERLEVSFFDSTDAHGWKKHNVMDYLNDDEFEKHPITFIKAGGKVLISESMYYRTVKQ